MLCDLHTHSNYSDGTDTPQELVAGAKQLHLTVALTDHNTTKGLPSFLEEAACQGVNAVAGIELTTDCNGTELHLLGLFLDLSLSAELERSCREFHVLKEIGNMEMAERLTEAGYPIDYATLKNSTPDGNINRSHFAAELYRQGHVASISDAFDTLLRDGGEFYVHSERFTLTDAIAALRKAHALPVLAHPLKDVDEAALRALLPDAIAAGLVGMEVQHSTYTAEKRTAAARIAAEFGLLPSGGSDYHGGRKQNVHLGRGCDNVAVPLAWYDALRAAHHALYG